MHNLLTMGHYNTPTNEDAGAEQSALLGHCFFDYAKPVGLIELLMRAVLENDKSATVLDFFAGTSTTAHAVMRLNANDSGSRPFIMIQRPEPCAPSSAAYRAGYENIAELSKERLRRAGTQILEKQNFHTKAPDVGFRVLKLHS